MVLDAAGGARLPVPGLERARSSWTDALRIARPGRRGAGAARRHVLSAKLGGGRGIDTYKSWPRLHYARRTTRSGVRELLVEKYRFKPENVLTLLDGE